MRRRLLLLFLLLLLAGILGLGWYAARRGFTSKWRGFVSREFRARGFEVTLRRLTFEPFRGLIAKDVRVYEASRRSRTLMVIDEMVLQVNYANFFRNEPFLDALELRDATLALPLDPEKPHGAKIEVSNLDARIFLPPEQIYLAQARARIFGIEYYARGQLINPQAVREKTGGARWPLETIARVLEELKGLRFGGNAPVVSLTFSGDLEKPGQIQFDVAAWGERVKRGSYNAHSIYVRARYQDGVLDLQQLRMQDTLGELTATGLLQTRASTGRWRVRSSLDWKKLGRIFPQWPTFQEFAFSHPPKVEASLEFDFGDPGANPPRPASGLVTGHVDCERFTWRAVPFESAEADFSWDGERWSVRNGQILHRSGPLRADLLQVPGRLRAHAESSLDLSALAPLLSGSPLEELAAFEFSRAPWLSVDAEGPVLGWEQLRLSGILQAGPGKVHGAADEDLSRVVRYEKGRLSLERSPPTAAETSSGKENSKAASQETVGTAREK